MGRQINGILLIDKNRGETSYEVVRRIKGILGRNKVGHAGTLDPFATGLLIILLGQGTRLSDLIMRGDKTYLATMTLGVETDTQDCTGRVVRTSSVPDVSREHIQRVAESFTGVIEQVPPAYSAVRYKGVRSYKLARKGIKVDLKKKKITVHSFRIISVNLPDIIIKVKCSSGTYVRSLAADFGKRIGSGAHLRSLRRLASGSFVVEDAIDSKELGIGNIKDGVISLKDAVPTLYEENVKQGLAEKIRRGYQPAWNELFPGTDFNDMNEGFVKLVMGDDLVAVAQVRKAHGKNNIKVDKVFHN